MMLLLAAQTPQDALIKGCDAKIACVCLCGIAFI